MRWNVFISSIKLFDSFYVNSVMTHIVLVMTALREVISVTILLPTELGHYGSGKKERQNCYNRGKYQIINWIVNFNEKCKFAQVIEVYNDGKEDGKCSFSGIIGDLLTMVINPTRKYTK